jgi:hypothetical protein
MGLTAYFPARTTTVDKLARVIIGLYFQQKQSWFHMHQNWWKLAIASYGNKHHESGLLDFDGMQHTGHDSNHGRPMEG